MRVIATRPVDSAPPEPPLSEPAAEAWIPRTCFKKGPPGRIGVELEYLVAGPGPDGRTTHYPRHRYPQLINALGADPHGRSHSGLDGRLTVEPGGQVELSSRPGDTLMDTVGVVHRDLALLRRRARSCGTRLIGAGVDPLRPPRRITDQRRYVAMERYFRPWGEAGPAMMCSTASVQVNVEAGTSRVNPADRWDLLHAVGPALVAAFANSPRRHGRATGFKSSRQAIWQDLDPARTGGPVRQRDAGLADAWARWALDAPLMMVRRDTGDWTAPRGLSFRGWLRHGRGAVPDRPPPSLDDLSYHLTTLFPPVRPRGHLEVRYLDQQPGCWWIVPTAVLAALVDDPSAAQAALAACEPTRDRWLTAARHGPADPALGRAAAGTLTAAAAALRGDPATVQFAELVETYLERWTLRGRCPADDPPTRSEPIGGCPVDGCDGTGETERREGTA